MKKVKVLILRTAGTNCDQETRAAFEMAGAEVELIHVNRLADGEASILEYDVFTIPGGFTYGDDLGAGKVLAVELTKRLGDELQKFVEDGRPVLGICNGFQVLVKTGLLPDSPEKYQQTVTLTGNDSNRFEDRWVRLKCPTSRCIFVEKDSVVEYPVAHAEGKFITRDEKVLDDLFENGQVVFQYVDENENECSYPGNPNGSPRGVAGICNKTGTVLGLMPHPERHIFGTQHPTWTRTGPKREGDGLAMFKNAVAYAKK